MTNKEYRKIRNSCIGEAKELADSAVPNWEKVEDGAKLWNNWFSLAMENLVKERLNDNDR